MAEPPNSDALLKAESDEPSDRNVKFRFVTVGAKGKLEKTAVRQVRSHTAIHAYKEKGKDGKVSCRPPKPTILGYKGPRTFF
jgi:hypothetical protein